MKFLSMLRGVVFFSVVVATCVVSLPPLPKLPSLSPLASPVSASSNVLPPPPPAVSQSSVPAAPADGGTPLPAVMFDGENEKNITGMGGARRENADRNTGAQRAITAVADLEKLVNQFHSLEATVDSSYTAFDKKMDGFYQEIFAVLGKSSTIIDNATSYLAAREVQYSDVALAQNKDVSAEFKKSCAEIKEAMTQCRAVIGEGSKMMSALKEAQASFDKDEDGIRASVLAFKNTSTEFITNYGKASSLKNEIFAQADDAKKQVDQIEELLKKTQELYGRMNSKDQAVLNDAIKKVQDGMAKATTDIAAMKAHMDKIEGFVAAIGKSEADIAAKHDLKRAESVLKAKKAEEAEQAIVSSEKKTSDDVPSEGDEQVRNGMAYAVIRTIGQGCKSLWASIVGVFSKIRTERIAANASALATDPELVEKRTALKTAAWSFGSGAWQFVSSAYTFVKHVFVKVFSRDVLVDVSPSVGVVAPPADGAPEVAAQPLSLSAVAVPVPVSLPSIATLPQVPPAATPVSSVDKLALKNDRVVLPSAIVTPPALPSLSAPLPAQNNSLSPLPQIEALPALPALPPLSKVL